MELGTPKDNICMDFNTKIFISKEILDENSGKLVDREISSSLALTHDEIKSNCDNHNTSIHSSYNYNHPNDYNTQILNEGSVDHFWSSAACDAGSTHGDDDLNKIKREALSMPETNFVNNLNIYEFKQEGSIDLDYDYETLFNTEDNLKDDERENEVSLKSNKILDSLNDKNVNGQEENSNDYIMRIDSDDSCCSLVSSVLKDHNYMAREKKPTVDTSNLSDKKYPRNKKGNELAQNNFAVLLEACEIRDTSVSTSDENTENERKVEKSSQLIRNLEQNESLIQAKLELETENKNNAQNENEDRKDEDKEKIFVANPEIKISFSEKNSENDIKSELSDDSSIPSLSDLDTFLLINKKSTNEREEEKQTIENYEDSEEVTHNNEQMEVDKSDGKNNEEIASNSNDDTENVSSMFLENRSEPLEYESNFSEALASDSFQNHEYQLNCNLEATINTSPKLSKNFDSKGNDTNETIEKNSNQEDSENSIVKDLKNFAAKLLEDCTNSDLSTVSKANEFFAMKLEELRKLSPKTNYKETEVQTEIIGGEFFKQRQKKMNDKAKKHLLKSSSESSSEDEEDDKESGTELYKGTDLENDEDNSGVEEIGEKGDNVEGQTDSSQNESDNETEPYRLGGLDLSKYVEIVTNSETTERSEAFANNSDVEMKKMDRGRTNDNKEDENDIDWENEDDFTNSVGDLTSDAETEIFDYKTGNDDDPSDINLKVIPNIFNDEKLKLQPIVVIEKMSEKDIDKYADDLRDKEIDRLLNFKGLLNPKVSSVQHNPQDQDKNKRGIKSKVENFLETLNVNELEKDSCSDDSQSDRENETITEKEYLERYNNNLKQQLLNSSSSDSGEELYESEEENYNTDDENSSSDDELLIDKFLEKKIEEEKLKNEENEEEKDNIEKADNNVENTFATKKKIPYDGSVEEDKSGSREKTVKVSENGAAMEPETIENQNEVHDDEESNKGGEDNKNGKPKRNLRHIIDSSGKLLKEKELDLESLVKNVDQGEVESESSDCEILDDCKNKRPKKQKSVETLLADASKRKHSNKNTDDLISLSSASEAELEEMAVDDEARKRILKPMLRQDQLAGETKIAQKQEVERIRRLEKKQQMMKKVLERSKEDSSELILDYNPETSTFIKVHPEIVKHLKEHQIEGVKFMYDSCYGSIKHMKNHPGSGCILAHCMGLGKTLQLIALLHTVISYQELNTSKILVLCPKSTVMNWRDEIHRWLGPIKKHSIKIYYFQDASDIQSKLQILQEWSLCGKSGVKKVGVLLIGYEAFRTLVFYHAYKNKRGCSTAKERDIIENKVKETLLEPGADLVICDEGHIIKNRKAAISTAVAQIKTPRRIILTGTPIQNNLKEYYSMVNFIKPSFLGTEKEFANLYANPIKNGQHKDSSKHEIKIMKQRSFVLHKKLSKFVQRKEAALLKTFLPDKYEYVLFVPMTEIQNRLYEFFLEAISKRQGSKGKCLIPDYTCLRKIWTHPKVLEIAWRNATDKSKKEAPKTATPVLHSDDEVPDDVYDSQTGELSVTNDWWRPIVTEHDLETLLPSNKLQAMFEILRMCEENGEKCLIFSAFVAVLNVVEHFMNLIGSNNCTFANSGLEKFKGPWVPNLDYYRLDGKTSKTLRHELVKKFNNPNNKRTRCFLISARAGGQGINLIGANRVIILDTSWNPSNDQQNIFRIFRLGQKKKCYVYRLLSMGTMEEKVYSRSVTKQAMSFRVVDEQQIDRHYSMAELTELYTLTKPDYSERPVPVLPQDNILASLLRNFPNLIFKYHEHDSLLENKMEQELSEQEKADAWAQYERDLQFSQEPGVAGLENAPFYNPAAAAAAAAAYNQRGYPMPYGLSPLSMPGLNFPSGNAIFDTMYGMYGQFPGYTSLLSRMNQSNQSVGLQSPFGLNFPQPTTSGLSTQGTNMLPPSSNNLSLAGLSPFTPMNTTPQNPFLTTPSTHSAPLLSSNNNSTSTNRSDIFADLKRLFENSGANPLVPYDMSRNQPNLINNPANIPSSLFPNTLSNPVSNQIDGIPTSVIRNPDLLPNITPPNTFRNEVENLTHFLAKNNPEASNQLTNNLENSNLLRAKSNLPDIRDQNKTTRGMDIGMLYSDKIPTSSVITGNPTSTISTSSITTSPTQKNSNITVRSVNSINQSSAGKAPTPTLPNKPIFPATSKSPYQRQEKPVQKPPVSTIEISPKSMKDKSIKINPAAVKTKTRILPAKPFTSRQVNEMSKSNSKGISTNNPGTAVTRASPINTPSGINLHTLGNKNLPSTNIVPQFSVPVGSNSNSNLKHLSIVSSPKSPLVGQHSDVQNKSPSIPVVANSANNAYKPMGQPTILSKNVVEQLKLSTATNKNLQGSTGQTLNKTNIRTSSELSISGPKSNSPITPSRNLVNKRASYSENGKTPPLLMPSSKTVISKIIPSNNQLISNQVGLTNKNALSSLSNRSDLSIRPIPHKSSSSGIQISSIKKPGNIKVNETKGTSMSTFTQGETTSISNVRMPNFQSRKDTPKSSTVVRKRPGSNLAIPDDVPISVSQMKRAKKLPAITPHTASSSPTSTVSSTTRSPSSNMGLPDSFMKIRSSQNLTVIPRSSKPQPNQKVVKEGISMWKTPRGGRN